MMTAATNVWPFSSDSPPAVILTSLRSTSRISSLKSWTWIPRRVSRFSSTASLTARWMELVSKKLPAFRVWNSAVPPVTASAGIIRKPSNSPWRTSTRIRESESGARLGPSRVLVTSQTGFDPGFWGRRWSRTAGARLPVQSAMAIRGVRPCWRPASRTETPTMPTKSKGSRTVENTNVFVRTRARYSRFQISHSLRIRCGDLLDENIVQGGLHKLEPSDFDSVLDRRLKDFLRVSARPQFCLNHRSVTVDAFDDVGQFEEAAIPRVFDPYRILSERLLDGLELAAQNRAPVVNQANGVAHHLDLLHAVGGEDDGCARAAEIQHNA